MDSHDASARTDAPSTWPDRAYTFVVISLGLLLMGLAAFRPPVEQVTHATTFDYVRTGTPEAPESGGAVSIEAELRSPALLEKALGRIRPQIHPPHSSGSQLDLLRDLAKWIEVDVTPAADTQTKHVRLEITGRREGFQYQLARHLVDVFTESHTQMPGDLSEVHSQDEGAGHEPVIDSATLQEQLAAAVDAVDQAHDRLDDFVTQRLADEREAHQEAMATYLQGQQAPAEAAAESAQNESSPRTSTIVQAVNPQRRQIERELARLRARRGSHLNVSATSDSLTDGSALDEAIRALEARLGETPEFVESQLEPQTNPYVSVDAVVRDAEATESEVDASPDSPEIPRFDEYAVRATMDADPTFQHLQAQVEEATAARIEALRAIREAPQRRRSLVQERVRVTQPPKVTARLRGAVTGNRLLGLLLPSSLLGLLCAWYREEPYLPETFLDDHDVEEWLELPVVGSVSTKDGPEIPEWEASELPSSVWWVRRGAEVTICLALVTVMVSIASVSGFGRTILSDPFTAYTQALDNVARLFT